MISRRRNKCKHINAQTKVHNEQAQYQLFAKVYISPFMGTLTLNKQQTSYKYKQKTVTSQDLEIKAMKQFY